MTTTDRAAGARLRLERERLGLSLLALATGAGTSTTTLYGAERYGRIPRAEVRERIARALGLQPGVIWRSAPRTTADPVDDPGAGRRATPAGPHSSEDISD